MTDPLDEALIDRYIAGECSQDEIDRVQAWVGTDPGRHDQIVRARALWQAAHAVNDQWDVDGAWARARKVVRPSALADQSTSPLPQRVDDAARATPLVIMDGALQRHLSVRQRLLFAAAACLLIAIPVLGWRLLAARHATGPTPESIATAPRQRVNLQLSDGTRVVLAPQSRLLEGSRFGEATREVTLNGAGYFDVAHDPRRPFVVATRRLRIRDAGTQFAVEAYGEDSAAASGSPPPRSTVAVTAGSVEIEPLTPHVPTQSSSPDRAAMTGPVRVNAGSVAHIDPQGRATLEQPADMGKYVGWTTGVLTFDDLPLSEVAGRLEHWYGVRIVLGDPRLACRHVTASFHDESLKDVLAEIGVALRVRSVWTDGPVTLEPIDRMLSPHAHDRGAAAGGPCVGPAGR